MVPPSLVHEVAHDGGAVLAVAAVVHVFVETVLEGGEERESGVQTLTVLKCST